MRGLDRQLEFISERYDLKYSRYADDMAFSGRTISSEFIIAVVNLIKSYGFELNQKKFAHKKINQRKMVTGLCISGSHVRVLKKARRKFRQNHYCLMLYKENSFNGTFGDLDLLHLDRVLGHGRFIQYIEPDNLYVNKAVDELVVLKKELLCP